MSATVAFEPEFVEALRHLFQERIPFNRVLGLAIDTIAAERVTGHLTMRPELVGHDAHQRLHGGVTSAALDAMGGLAVMAALGARHMVETPAERMKRYAKLGTVDLRVDYLRPGIGERFELHGEVLRLGSRVATTRMELLSAGGTLLALGTAAYMVS